MQSTNVKNTLYGQCARMFMVGFPGKEPTLEFEKEVHSGLLGAILFTRNLGTLAETAELCGRIKHMAGRPFMLALDQEGGRVARLKGPPFTPVPSMREIGRTEDAERAHRVGRLLAFEMRAAGFDWDFAPVLDVDTNPKNPVIGDRAFHSDPQVVTRLGLALARGLEEGGVASCAKHFPGHGDTEQDSHLALPRLTHPWKRLEQIELVPFRAYAQAKLASVMTAHVLFDAVDKDAPATLSPRVIGGLLREQLGFQGVVVSDDLEMKAIAEHYSVAEAAVLGALAGIDLFLVCNDAAVQQSAIEALVHAAEAGRLPRSRIAEANARLDRLVERFEHPASGDRPRLGSAEHQKLAEGLRGESLGLDPTERIS